MSQKYKLNHIKSPPDTRDYIIKLTTQLKNQKSVDLSQSTDIPKDQGSIGSCTAFAGVGLMENFYHRNLGGKITDLLSEKFLYYTTRVNIAKWPINEDSGAYIRDTMKAMVKYGVALEKTFPYLTNGQTDCSYSDSPPPSAYTEALNYQVTKYATITDKSQSNLKILLQNGYAFIGGVTCYENFFSDTNGLIPVPQGQVIGGHALLFVGYDDTKQVFKFKNSWGVSWGDKGYGYLPYEYFRTNKVDDIWTIYAQEYDNKPFEIIVPIDRSKEFTNRINSILIRLSENTELQKLIQEIKANPNNSKLFTTDIVELCNLAQRLVSNINISKTISEKNNK